MELNPQAMLQELKDYAKCAVRNRAVLGSYACTSVGLSLLTLLITSIEPETGTQLSTMDTVLFVSGVGTFDAGIVSLGLTKFGTPTYHSYQRMREHIKKHGTIDQRFKDSFSPLYCTQVGIKMAAEEAGLENLI